MAYAFNRLNSMLTGKKNDPTSSGYVAKAPSPMPTQENQKTDQQQNVASTGRSIYEKNPMYGAEAVASRITNPAAQEASGIISGIEDNADKYITSERNRIESQTETPNQNDIIAAGKGDAAATKKITAALNPTTYVPTAFNIAPPQPLSQTEYSRTGDVGSYLQKQSGGRYTKGMGATDSMLLGRAGGQAVSKNLGNLQAGIARAGDAAQSQAAGVQSQVGKIGDYTRGVVRQGIASRGAELQAIIDQILGNTPTDLGKQEADTALSDVYSTRTKGMTPAQLATLKWDPSKFITNSSVTSPMNTMPELGELNTLAGLDEGDSLNRVTDPTVTQNQVGADVAGANTFFDNWLASLKTGEDIANNQGVDIPILPEGAPSVPSGSGAPIVPGQAGQVVISGESLPGNDQPNTTPLPNTGAPPITQEQVDATKGASTILPEGTPDPNAFVPPPYETNAGIAAPGEITVQGTGGPVTPPVVQPETLTPEQLAAIMRRGAQSTVTGTPPPPAPAPEPVIPLVDWGGAAPSGRMSGIGQWAK